MGFFTDTTVCIGCKACEVACKEWNLVPNNDLHFTGESYDHTGRLDANNWRHVAFIEQRVMGPPTGREAGVFEVERRAGDGAVTGLRWLMESDVCKHCASAGCLDVCPTGALFRTEFGTVVVQEDICNGCGYCVPACPFGVLDQREGDGRVWKCTLCYDRLREDMEPACALACPTDSIQFGTVEELRRRADRRLDEVVSAGFTGARLYLADGDDGIGGASCFFLLLDDPEVYALPPDPVVPTRTLGQAWAFALTASLGLVLGALSVTGGGRK